MRKVTFFQKMGFKPLVCVAVFSFQLLVVSSFAQNPSGVAGSLTWELNLSDSTLTISGNDTMPDYARLPHISGSYPPWNPNIPGSMAYSIAKVVINDGVKSIGKNAFYACKNLTTVSIPNTVSRIGENAFSGTGLMSLPFLPSSITEIEGGTFAHCPLTSVSIPNTITVIGGAAFCDCSSLDSITIPHSVTTIGTRAFQDCTGLTSITIPHLVTTIGGDAFMGCNGLTYVVCHAKTPPVGSVYSYNVPTKIPVYVPCGSIADYQTANGWKLYTNYQVIGFPLNSFPSIDSVTVSQESNGLEISWQGTDALSYEIYRNNAILTTVGTTTYKDTTVENRVYCYKIKAIYELCESGFSPETCKGFSDGTGINELRSNEVTKLRVYPNPAGNQLKIKNYELKEGEVIEIYDVVGQKLNSYQFSIVNCQLIIDVSHLANGMYYLKVGNKTVRFVKE